MNDRRQHSRLQPSAPMEVFEHPGERYLGRVVDLSAEGFMLCSPQPQPANTLVECRLVATLPGSDSKTIHFTADCLWSRPGEQGQQSWAGYQIIDIEQQQNLVLERLLRLMGDSATS